ncbi:hypothetical protein JYU02_00425 [bacterium AH-315-P15]|nr:hypothetical protein [bacterium AH-315-P15]
MTRILDEQRQALFWAGVGHIDVLRDGVIALLSHTAKTGSFLAESVVRRWCEHEGLKPSHYMVDARTYTRFVRGETPIRSESKRTVLLLASAEWARQFVNHGSIHIDEPSSLRAVKSLIESAAIYRLSNEDRPPKSPDDPHASQSLGGSIDTIIQLMGLATDGLTEPYAQFFEQSAIEDGAPQANFTAYRFDTHSGKVIKSLLAIHKPNGLSPLCRFGHFFRNNFERKRTTRGAVVSFEKTTVFMGSVDHGDSLEAILLRKQRYAQSSYDGLILTIDDEGSPVASRIVLVRTNKSSDEEIGSGIYNLSEIDDLSLDILNRIRNRVHFKLESELRYRGRKKTQGQVLSLIADLLSDGDKHLLVDDRGQPFNPAAEEHYTYNSALGLPRADGK